MYQNSKKINGHWDAFMRADLPLTDGGTQLTFETANIYRKANGYDRDNEVVYFPVIQGTDGRIYHISVLAAANIQELLLAQDGIPYKSASNTECAIIENLYLGEAFKDRIFDDDIINKKLEHERNCLSSIYRRSVGYLGCTLRRLRPEFCRFR